MPEELPVGQAQHARLQRLWNAFKSQGGPTYAGAGWKRYTDFLVSKMPELGAVDLDYVDIPYDHYIVEDWPDRRTHMYDRAWRWRSWCPTARRFRWSPRTA